MKKVLVVGFTPYELERNLEEKYPNVLWFFASNIRNIDSPQGISESVKIMDEILFYDGYINNRIGWEVACVMCSKDISSITDYPVDGVNKGEEE